MLMGIVTKNADHAGSISRSLRCARAVTGLRDHRCRAACAPDHRDDDDRDGRRHGASALAFGTAASFVAGGDAAR